MRQLFTKSLLAGAVILSIVASSALAEDKIELRVETAWTVVDPMSPLLVKVTVVNVGGQRITIPLKMGAEFSTVRCLIQSPGSDSFDGVPVVLSGVSGFGSTLTRELQPGEEFSCVEMVLAGDRRIVLKESGRYALKGKLVFQNATLAESESVLFSVKSGKADQDNITRSARVLIHRAVMPGSIPSTIAVGDIVRASAQLPETHLRDVLNWLVHVAKVRDARSKEELDKATEAAFALLESLEPIPKEWFSIVVARQCVAIKQWDAARKALRTVPENSYEHIRLSKGIIEGTQLLPVPNGN